MGNFPLYNKHLGLVGFSADLALISAHQPRHTVGTLDIPTFDFERGSYIQCIHTYGLYKAEHTRLTKTPYIHTNGTEGQLVAYQHTHGHSGEM